MSVTPEGPISLPLENARLLLADSTTFKALMEVATATLAYDRTFLWTADDTDTGDGGEGTYPRCILSYEIGGFGFKQSSTTGGMHTGPIDLAIEVETPDDYQSSPQDAFQWLANQIGKVWAEILVLARSGGSPSLSQSGHSYLNVTESSLDQMGASDVVLNNGRKIMGASMTLHWRGQ